MHRLEGCEVLITVFKYTVARFVKIQTVDRWYSVVSVCVTVVDEAPETHGTGRPGHVTTWSRDRLDGLVSRAQRPTSISTHDAR